MRCYSCRKYDDCERPWKCDGTMYDCTAYELEQTNEEWFCTLSTEEKAKWLSRNSKFMYGCGRMETTPKVMYEEDWECWLKEIHESEGNDVSVH